MKYHFSSLLSGGLLVAGSMSGQQTSHKDLPNILVFVADDAGMDFGCYGNKVIKTPQY